MKTRLSGSVSRACMSGAPWIRRLAWRSRLSRSGLTFPEIMMALTILGFVLASFMMGFSSTRRTAAMTKNQLKGLNAGRQAMEELLANKFFDSPLSTGIHQLANGYYTVSYDPSDTSIKDIIMRIKWAEPFIPTTTELTFATSITRALHE